MAGLPEHTAIRESDGKAVATLDKAWELWGPNGGYMASIALRAAGRAAPRGHRPLSLKCHFLNPGRFEEVEIRPQVLKQGRTAVCTRIDLVQRDSLVLTAEVWTSNKSQGPIVREHARPGVPRPNDVVPLEERPKAGAPQHPFWRNFERRPVKDRVLGVPDPRGARLEGWYRYRDFEETDDPYLDFSRAVVLIDTLLWPTFFFSQPQPVDYLAVSLDLSVWFHQAPGPRDWLLIDSKTDTAGGGVIFGDARAWADDGRLIATGAGQMLTMPLPNRR